MAQELVKDPRTGKWVLKGTVSDTSAYVPDKPQPAPKAAAKQQKNWWQQTLNDLQYEVKRVQSDPVGAAATYLRNTSPLVRDTNNIRHEVRQLTNPATRAQRLQQYGATAARAVLANPATPQGQLIGQAGPAIATAGANLVRNFGGAGTTIDQAEDRAYQWQGQKPPSEMSQGELAMGADQGVTGFVLCTRCIWRWCAEQGGATAGEQAEPTDGPKPVPGFVTRWCGRGSHRSCSDTP